MKVIGLSALILFLTLLYSQSFAQQCGFENYGVIVVKVVEEESGAFIPNLDLQLAHGDGSPINAIANEADRGSLCSEPYVFWENNSKKIPQQDCKYSSMHRTVLAGIGQAYICIVPLQNDCFDLSQRFGVNRQMLYNRFASNRNIQNSINDSMLWHIKINGAKKNKATLLAMPLCAPVDICAEHLSTKYNYTGSSWQHKIISVVRGKNNNFQVRIQPGLYDRYILPVYRTISTGGFSEIAYKQLSRVLVIDDSSASCVQTIGDMYDESKQWKNEGECRLEWLDWNNRFIRQQRVFRVPTQNDEEQNQNNNSYLYYRYNERSKVYEKYTLLNSMDYIQYNPTNFRITGFVSVHKQNQLYKEQYVLKDTNWVIENSTLHTFENPTQPAPPVYKPQEAFLSCREANKFLPVQWMLNKNEISINDTIWVSNAGDEAVKIKLNPTTYFSVLYGSRKMSTATIQAHDSVAVVYERKFKPEMPSANSWLYAKGPFDNIVDFCSIEYKGKFLNLSMNYMLLNENAKLQVKDDGSKIFTQNYYSNYDLCLREGLQILYYLSTYPDGFVHEFGKQLSSGDKIGQWQIYEAHVVGQAQHWKGEMHNKLLNLQLYNDSIKNYTYEMFYKWNMTGPDSFARAYRNCGNMVTLLLQSNSYGINIMGKDLGVNQLIDWASLPEIETMSLYVLQPEQPYYYSHNIKVPMDFYSDAYRVVFSFQYMNSLVEYKKLDKDAFDVLCSKLQHYFDPLRQKFPNLKVVLDLDTMRGNQKFDIERTSSRRVELTIDLSACNEAEKRKIKGQIVEDKNIVCLSRLLHKDKGVYADGGISLVLSSFKPFLDETMMQQAKKFGFELDKQTGYAVQGNTTFMRYHSKIIDDQFFKDYNNFCEMFKHDIKFYLQTNGYQARLEEADTRRIKE